MEHPSVKYISDCFIKPRYITEESKQPVYLAPWDLIMLSLQYMQYGLIFTKPPDFSSDENSLQNLLEKLKQSLSVTLVHFYPFSGRLSTLKQEPPHLYTVFIDCANSPGARFIQASLESTVSDILSPVDVPPIVQSFFDHDRAINHDGHDKSLLSIQVTELIDGIIIGCSMNHVVADGTSFWHFMNTWSEVFKAGGDDVITISRLPIHKRWFPEGKGPILNLPYTHHDQFIKRYDHDYDSPLLRERIFHFSADTLAKIKSKANSDCNNNKISTLQALLTHIWRVLTRARRIEPDQSTSCRMAIDNRSRLNPPLPDNYFGNCVQTIEATVAAGQLLQESLGWAAQRVHQAVIDHNNERVHEWVDSWMDNHFVYHLDMFDSSSIMVGGSPRFDVYGNEFGLGKAVALRSGYGNKYDTKVSLYPGVEGGSSMDLEICLVSHVMSALESDQEFLDTITI